ncbi:uncharacterized protein LOC142577690 [Dermacentor variabilis]|uniref:uncharacterized protein LOC142577690 n=1 Tax=Dermacentor variabilis TaxID=34621 RepID=UPI003F5B3D14
MAHNMRPSFPFFDARATDANNVGTEWLKWVKRFENFIVACGITADARKTAILLHYAGEEVYDIYCALPDPPAAAAASTVSSTGGSSNATPLCTAARRKLDDYFAPPVNTTFEVYRFRQAKQMESESLDAFYARLRQLVRHCTFADDDTEIKNQILLSTTSTRLRQYAMQHDLDLQGILKQGRLFKEVEHDISVIEQESRQCSNIPNVLNVSDDILVYGKTEKEHDKTFKATLECLLASGLTLNVKKCKFNQRELTFFGHVFSSNGVQPDPTKVSAILGASPPSSATEVKSLLGLVNYCGRFIPNLAHLTQSLGKLTAKGEDWCWTDIQQDALDELKRQLSEATTLAYFDPGKNITLIVDAAPHGLGAILTQTSGSETRVVAYGSRALSPVEARYSQI